jgi:hypothetical protein
MSLARPRRNRGSRRRAATLAVCLVAVASATAWAIWSADSTPASHVAAGAASVNQGATPTADAAAGRKVTVGWSASTLSNGHAVDGYVIKRYDAGTGALQTTLAGCAGTITAVSCVETGVPAGQWKYAITPLIATNWRGAEGAKSTAATVGTATISLAKTLFGAPLPQSTTGSLAGFAAGEGVTYRLDSSTMLTGSPSSAGSAGTATISSLAIPSTSDGPHTIYAIGDGAPYASQASVAIIVDATSPTASAQLTPAANAAGWNNSTPVAVALSATDGSGSGVDHIAYTTDGTDPATSGTSHVYSSPISVSTTTTVKYVATDLAANASGVQTQLVRIDLAAPAGGSVDATGLGGTGARYSTSTALSVAFAPGTDGGSGLATSGAQLLRASATLTSDGTSAGSCGSYGLYGQVGADDPTSPKSDSVPLDHACYRYRYVVTDQAGNSATYTSPDIKVDTTAPAAPALGFSAFANTSVTGTTLYYRPDAASGAVTLTATSSDADSGVASYGFPALGSGWTSTPGATGVTTYSYSAPNPTAPSGSQNVTATNHAGQASAAGAFTVASDATPPAGGTITYSNGYVTSAPVSVSFTPGSDGGSAINAASGVLQRGTASLAGGVCAGIVTFATIAVSPTSPYSDGGVSSGQCYQYRYLISDAVGNQATYTNANVLKLDTQGPTHAFSLASPIVGASLSGTTLYYKGNAAGSFKLVDTLTDPSGVVSATFPAIATTGWTHAVETVATPAGGPFTSTTFSWIATPTNPAGFAVSALDNATNSSSTGITFASDTTAPTGGSVSYTDDVYNTLSVPITTTNGSDGESGVNAASGVVKRDESVLTPATQACAAFPGTYATNVTLVGGADTSVVTGRCYRYEWLVSDNVGNQATFTSSAIARVDTSGPQVTAIASQELSGATGDGFLEVGDKLILTFNQSLAAGSLPATFINGSETRGSSVIFVVAPNVLLTIPGITQGPRNTGTAGYFVGCAALCGARTATFDGTVELLNGGVNTTVKVTVTSLGVDNDTAFSSSGNLAFAPASTIKDRGGNSATGTPTFNGFRLF